MGFTTFELSLRTRKFMVDWAKTEVDRLGGVQEAVKQIPMLCSMSKYINQRGVEALKPPAYGQVERARLRRFFAENEM